MSIEPKFAKVKFATLDRLKSDAKPMIAKKSSFEVVDVNNMSEVVSVLEGAIEEGGLRCRTYTNKRSVVTTAAAAGGVAGWASMTIIPVLGVSLAPVVGLAGIGAAIGIGAHRLATRNPDYEIIKHPLDKKIVVEYKK